MFFVYIVSVRNTWEHVRTLKNGLLIKFQNNVVKFVKHAKRRVETWVSAAGITGGQCPSPGFSDEKYV